MTSNEEKLSRYEAALRVIAAKELDATVEFLRNIAETALHPPVRGLTPEEYEAKVAAGKKITWAVDQGKSPLKQDD